MPNNAPGSAGTSQNPKEKISCMLVSAYALPHWRQSIANVTDDHAKAAANAPHIALIAA